MLPNLEYCCQLWAPLKADAVRKLEAVQRTFTYRISSMRDGLELLGKAETPGTVLAGEEKRRERYIILYTGR